MLHSLQEHEELTHSKDSEDEVFDPEADYIKHSRVGVWDVYEDKRDKKDRLQALQPSLLVKLDEILTALPFVTEAFKTLIAVCFNALIVYVGASFVDSLLPAITLFYSGQLLQVVQESIDSRTVDKKILFNVLSCTIACAVLRQFTNLGKQKASERILRKMRSHYAEHVLRAHIRFDVPTFKDPVVRSQLDTAISGPNNAAWNAIRIIIGTGFTLIQLVSQFIVLVRVLRGRPDGFLLAVLSFAEPVMLWIKRSDRFLTGAWVATCRNLDYLRMEGFKILVSERKYRQELVAGNMQEYVISEFKDAQERVGFDKTFSVHEIRNILRQERQYLPWSFLNAPLHELPQVIFTLRAVQYPKSIPVSLTSLTLIRSAVASFSSSLMLLLHDTESMSEAFLSIRKLYEIINVQNKVIDGTMPYPENSLSTRNGIALEFRNVSFKYPDTDKFALRNVSFSIGAGQLCVLVGFNGSGKSTILKLLMRLYDTTEGVILVDGHDIKTLKLADLRRCVSVLFQDYTHFPLSVRENIGMGNAKHAMDDDMIREAAALGGAMEIIEDLPEDLDTFLRRPVRDYFSGLPEGTRSLFGRNIDHTRLRGMSGRTKNLELSGGQMQRLALSRTFMSSLGDDSNIGLFLFDEPSASLDPTAEHELFERLRQLRGNKTMIFSSHRFGQLTRYADKILYMVDSVVTESGTHDELLKLEGGYSKMYNIQAAHFK